MKSEWQKAEYKYSKAESELRQLRDKLYPIGTKGTCKYMGWDVVVIPGSLYADQVNTNHGHMSPRSFIKKETPNE